MLNPRFAAKSVLLAAFVFLSQTVKAAEPASTQTPRLHLEKENRSITPQVAPASDEAELALKRFHLSPGFSAGIFAAEPMLANPVAFCLDEHGRVFVAETHRYRSSVLDIRNYMLPR